MQNSVSRCPSCHAPIPPDAPGGICPACALLGVSGFTTPPPPVMPALEEIAAAFPELELIEVIGQGGMGLVFKARQPRIERLVALKILPPALAAQPGFAVRFTREARALAKLAHPHIVAVYDFGERAGFYYLLMEFVNGVNLRQAMRAGVTPEQALLLVPRICEALQFAHDRGVLHRDIKPENILLDTVGTPKLADFGIAKLADDAPAATGLTQTGAQLGTAAYMAPEQIEKPATVDHRADIYSLGVVLYEMLTGELPLGRFAAPSEKSSVHRGVDEVVLRALEKERERRQQSATEMRTQVEYAATHPGVRPRAAFANPWPNRLFWLVIAGLVLPLVTLFCAIVLPRLARISIPEGGWTLPLVALLPFLVGTALFLGYRRMRPGADRAAPRATWNPWPRRVFLLLTVLVILPTVPIGIGLLLPMLASDSRGGSPARSVEMSTEVKRENQARLDELKAAQSVALPDVAGLQDDAIRLARARLKETKERIENGTAPALEQSAAERDLAIAEARTDETKIAGAQVAYAETRLAILKEQAQAGTASAAQVREAEHALNAARLQSEQAREKFRAGRDTTLESPPIR